MLLDCSHVNRSLEFRRNEGLRVLVLLLLGSLKKLRHGFARLGVITVFIFLSELMINEAYTCVYHVHYNQKHHLEIFQHVVLL